MKQTINNFMEHKFEQTLEWAKGEEKNRKIRGQGISSFYLIISSFMIIGLLVFIVYLVNKNGDEYSALEMIKDPENEFDDNFSNNHDDSGYDDNSGYDDSGYDED